MAATLTLRSVKGTPLTNNEVDANFTGLNTAIGDLETQIGATVITIDGDASGSATFDSLETGNLTLDISSITGNLDVSQVLSSNSITVTNSITAGTTITALDFNSTSDIAMKEDLQLIDSPLSKLSQLNGYTFNWKNHDKTSVGIIAQEVEKVLPQIVTVGSDGLKRVSYDSLIPLLIEAVKELSAKIK